MRKVIKEAPANFDRAKVFVFDFYRSHCPSNQLFLGVFVRLVLTHISVRSKVRWLWNREMMNILTTSIVSLWMMRLSRLSLVSLRVLPMDTDSEMNI
ncbi:hypothetical protein L1987_60192 [Smallanthus sonchifolius]|uniref:Uncharacterized protein n=1 Tax=Smallanthus sonchifolius TaxID=185202 RepID=A0ACB9D7A5_9ASTR|nr:hypothetical protein L1987_60192 [Smallanthus sonchifolius]